MKGSSASEDENATFAQERKKVAIFGISYFLLRGD